MATVHGLCELMGDDLAGRGGVLGCCGARGAGQFAHARAGGGGVKRAAGLAAASTAACLLALLGAAKCNGCSPRRDNVRGLAQN